MNKKVVPIDIVKAGLSRHGHQYGKSNKFRSWIATTLEPLSEIQAAFFGLLDINLDTATGVKLDLIGRIVGAPAVVPDVVPIAGYFGFDKQDLSEPFGELDDPNVGGIWLELGQTGYTEMILSEALYRLVIRAQIIKNTSLCTPTDIINIARMIIREDVSFAYAEQAMAIIIAPRSYLNRAEIELLRLMIPRPCGVALGIVNGFPNEFGFKGQEESLGMTETNNKAIGGYWSILREDLQQFFNSEDKEIWL